MAITYFTNIAFSSDQKINLTESDFQTFLQVLKGGRNGAHLKKIKGQQNTYSAYLNDGARLLFVQDDSALRLMGKFHSHDEYMATLKRKGLASQYLKALTKEEFDFVFSITPHPEYTLSDAEHSALLNKIDLNQKLPQGLYCTLEGKHLVLNEKQKSLGYCDSSEQGESYTRLLTGGPGTGKTVSLMSEFEEAYGKATQIADLSETKHSSEEVQEFLYLTTTSQLAGKVTKHFDMVIPNKILPLGSYAYQDFAAMVDPTIPPVQLSSTDIEEAIDSGQKQYKRLKTEADFIAWCEQQKIKPEKYLENAGDNTVFYKKLYQEFRILSAYPNLAAYQELGVLESLFFSDKTLQKSLYELYERYTKDFIDLNFYDLSTAIADYKRQHPHLVSNLFLDEAQNLSRVQFLNLKAYANDPKKMVISLDPRQSVYDPISNFKFIKRCFESSNVRILSIELEHSYRVPFAVSTLLQQVQNLAKEHAGGCTESKHQAEIYTTHENKPGKLVVMYANSPQKAELLKECQNLCKRPNCLVIVGDSSLLAEAQAALAESEADTLMFYTSDESIGLEFDHVILYKPWAGFTESELQSLMDSLGNMSDSKGTVNKPKDKHDKSKHSAMPKLHQFLVGASRALESLRIIPGVDSKPILSVNQTTPRAQKKQAKGKISPIAGLTEYLLKTSTIISQPNAPDSKRPCAPEEIHQEWVKTCWKLIVDEKEYEKAQRICEQKRIKVEELNLPEGLRAQIPVKHHTTFFRAPIQMGLVNLDYLDDLLKTSNFQANKILTLLKKDESSLEEYLMITLARNGKTLWENIFQDAVKTHIFLTAANTNLQNRKKIIALGAKLPGIKSPHASCYEAILSALDDFKDCALAKELLALGNIEEKDIPEILCTLGKSYEEGSGSKRKDLRKAITFYAMASKRGHGESSFKLGNIYADSANAGLKDAQENANMFYREATAQKHPAAREVYAAFLQKKHARPPSSLSQKQPAATVDNGNFFNALRTGDIPIISLFIQKNPSLINTEINGNFPLFIAAQNGHEEAIRVLHAAGAKVNTPNNNKVTPMFIAANNGHTEAIKVLLAAGANVGTANNEGMAVWIAAQNGHAKAIKVLHEKGVKVGIANNEGMTPLWIAAQNGHAEAIKELHVSGANVDKSDNNGMTPVWIAAQNGHTDAIKVLLEAGANVDTASAGMPPLWIAAQNGHAEAIKVLHAAGANVDTANKNKVTPVWIAAYNGHTETIKVLHAAGANVDKSDKDGRTPVYASALKGYAEALKTLLNARANVGTVNNEGRTPVWAATQKGHTEAIKILRQAGANMNQGDNDREPLSFTAAKN